MGGGRKSVSKEIKEASEEEGIKVVLIDLNGNIIGTGVLATEDTLAGIKSQTDKLQFDTNNFLRMAVANQEILFGTDIQEHWAEAVTLLASGTRTASGNGSDVDVGRFIAAEVTVDVTDVSGTFAAGEGLTVYIEGKDEITGEYHTIWNNSTPYTAVTSPPDRFSITLFTDPSLAFRLLRVRWSISGTSPSFTFSVTMQGKA